MKRCLVALFCLCLVAGVEAAKIKVQAQPDPEFDFATLHTWAWDADAGKVIMAVTQKDDPAPIKAQIDPMIRKYVEAAMVAKGLKVATTGTPDVQLHYYVLVTVNSTGQYMGQFLPSVVYWGLPPFSAGATTSLDVVTKGSLVLDAMLPGAVDSRRVVWRGIAQSTVDVGSTSAQRASRLEQASNELIKRFPLTKMKKK